MTSGGITTGTIAANGVVFSYFECGTGPLALCLHGFPDSAHTWRHLLPLLADEGFRAVAPFQRGYAPTSVPADGYYQTGALSLDAIELHSALGGDGDAVIVGHDWGAVGTYGAAVHAPDRWSKVVALAVPPAGAIAHAFASNVDQLKRSWYMFFFQHPLADLVVPGGDLAFVDRLWSDWSPGFDAAEDLALTKPSLRDPANLQAALGYYRAALGMGPLDPALAEVQAAGAAVPPQPTLYLHGATDGAIGAEVAEIARPLVTDNVSIEILNGCGHFLHLEKPEAVNGRIVEFLTS